MVLDETKVGRGFGVAVPCANFHSDMLPTLNFLEMHEKFLIPCGAKDRGGDDTEAGEVEALKCRRLLLQFLSDVDTKRAFTIIHMTKMHREWARESVFFEALQV